MKIVLFGLETSAEAYNYVQLVRLAEWNHNYLVTSIATYDDLIVTGDAVSSIAVLNLDGSKFKTLVRDYGPLWPLCLEMNGRTGVIGANVNLFSSFGSTESVTD